MGGWPGQRPPLKSFSGGLASDPLDPMSCFLSPQEGEAEDSMPAAHAGRVHSPRCGSEARARATGGALVPGGSHTAQHSALAAFSQFSVSACLPVKDRRPTPQTERWERTPEDKQTWLREEAGFTQLMLSTSWVLAGLGEGYLGWMRAEVAQCHASLG